MKAFSFGLIAALMMTETVFAEDRHLKEGEVTSERPVAEVKSTVRIRREQMFPLIEMMGEPGKGEEIFARGKMPAVEPFKKNALWAGVCSKRSPGQGTPRQQGQILGTIKNNRHWLLLFGRRDHYTPTLYPFHQGKFAEQDHDIIKFDTPHFRGFADEDKRAIVFRPYSTTTVAESKQENFEVKRVDYDEVQIREVEVDGKKMLITKEIDGKTGNATNYCLFPIQTYEEH